MATRLLTVLFVLALVAAACSTVDSRPTEFDDMTADEVGCTVWYGDTDPYVVGPLSSSDFEVIEPNDYTSFRIARTASDIVIVAKRQNDGMSRSTPLNDIPADGIFVRRGFRDAGNPGYEISCWRGER
ncbi:MAG: hypothetical protein BMS9Abin20_0223 [Acidimicrobiia bacterium]|nr:MAG: hypothetical protein BMS9Abin20_0223 [Acidimicrobiia bacterium]